MGYDNTSTIPQRNFSEMERLRFLLDEGLRRYNVPEFVNDDPVQFPRRFRSLPDREIAALLVSTISWGKRKMILANAERLLAIMHHSPLDYTLSGQFEELPRANIHRTFFTDNLRHYLRGLRLIYSRFGSLQAFAAHHHIAADEMPAWALAAAINSAICEANSGNADPRCLPANLDSTALKRLNMALRWLVRTDGIVDPGGWDLLTPAQLFIPLDVHVGNVGRHLGLLTRAANDRRAVVELTDALRSFRSDDPVAYDFALFGLGVTGANIDKP